MFVDCEDPDCENGRLSVNLAITEIVVDKPICRFLDLIPGETKNLIHILEAVGITAER